MMRDNVVPDKYTSLAPTNTHITRPLRHQNSIKAIEVEKEQIKAMGMRTYKALLKKQKQSISPVELSAEPNDSDQEINARIEAHYADKKI